MFRGPYFEWWDRQGEDEYVGIQDSIEAVRKWGLEHGPIDGIIGFSQGAAFASLLVAQSDPVLSGVKFVVLMSGFPPRDPRFMLPEQKISMPALCIYGKTDFLKDGSLQFANHFSEYNNIPLLGFTDSSPTRLHIIQ